MKLPEWFLHLKTIDPAAVARLPPCAVESASPDSAFVWGSVSPGWQYWHDLHTEIRRRINAGIPPAGCNQGED